MFHFQVVINLTAINTIQIANYNTYKLWRIN